MLCYIDFLCIFAPSLQFGALAHLARALDWQSKGGEFESRMLHNPFIYFPSLIIKKQLYAKKWKTFTSPPLQP